MGSGRTALEDALGAARSALRIARSPLVGGLVEREAVDRTVDEEQGEVLCHVPRVRGCDLLDDLVEGSVGVEARREDQSLSIPLGFLLVWVREQVREKSARWVTSGVTERYWRTHDLASDLR